MERTHRMEAEEQTADDVIFACVEEGCGRRVLLHRAGDLVVLDTGDFFARHHGATGPLTTTVSATSPNGHP